MDVTHTPLPWVVSRGAPGDPFSFSVESATQKICQIKYIPELALSERGQRMEEANAAFIKLACNSHYELLAACQALPDFDPENVDAADFKDHASEFMTAMRLARAAIAKAIIGKPA